ncbi:MAG TPA: ATP-grasp domain-containing protein [Vicinamibacterales bacterium]|nr:ATP-grasp domain-containing protein [Vicinamibacterales bacterium]
MPKVRVLVLSTTTGYQLRAFDDAARALEHELAFATDRCHRLDDPWRDRAIPVRFYDEPHSLGAIERAARATPIDGVVAVGDRPVVLAALAAERLGLPGNPPPAARVTTSKFLMRESLDRAGLPVPWFVRVPAATAAGRALDALRAVRLKPDITGAGLFPCVIKPLAMAASRGVVRADDEETFREAFERVQALLHRRDVRAQRNEWHGSILIEGYIPGAEHALEGVLHRGDLQALAMFDKPDPLSGPFFEETIYLTPSRLDTAAQTLIVHTVAAACRAIGLRHGPIHAEARVSDGRVYVLEVAARPIGGLCARALRFVRGEAAGAGAGGTRLLSLEELLLLNAVGTPIRDYQREPRASGVMMIPVPRRGQFRRVEGLDAARALHGIEDIIITAKRDQMLVPLPEGSSYPGFIFSRGDSQDEVEAALRRAHATLKWVVERPLDVLGQP